MSAKNEKYTIMQAINVDFEFYYIPDAVKEAIKIHKTDEQQIRNKTKEILRNKIIELNREIKDLKEGVNEINHFLNNF
jgi:hypothetical protein